jgi:MYXO-CTERM domain-containing protein
MIVVRSQLSLSLAILALVASPATAQVTLPNGLVVPLDSMNGEVQLYSLFSTRGEGIDWIGDAARTPDTFSPLCDFTATLLLNESASVLGVGWYNVVPGATSPPTADRIYTIVPPASPVGTVITGTSIREDPRYLGGLIGFALIRTPPHYSEARWNTVCDAGACASTPGPWILGLSYASTVTPNAWYLAFEDGDTTSSFWNNDGDYNDYVFLFTGLECAGGGEPCVVGGAQGICAAGLTECGPGGALTCRVVNAPRDEACDGTDSDCDGAIDEGDGLCSGVEVCVAGRCVAPCFEGGCQDGETCTEAGVCVETACVGVTCSAGERCVRGTCGDACEGVVCPGSLTCVAGRCVDPCAGVDCGEGVCERGVCVQSCTCRFCGTGSECAPSGACVPEGCAGVTCDAGEVCVAGGGCRDACADARCPAGQACEAGECRDLPPPDGGPPQLDAGAVAADGGSSAMDAGRPDAGARTDGGNTRGTASGGCGCRASSGPGAGALGFVLVGLAIVALRRRR